MENIKRSSSWTHTRRRPHPAADAARVGSAPDAARAASAGSAATKAPAGRRAIAKAEKRARILTAARTVMGEKGYAQMSMSEVASLADVAAGTVFQYAA
ncbi:TetR/AcrR family transcriptional regulator, partial [Streptomyces sp. tea 10]|nr:TetR/AcrR family transcriptional regulator [Streptomyces sp. tea 10]